MSDRGKPYSHPDPDLWPIIEQLFHQIADLPSDQQQYKLNQIRESGPETYWWLKTLLEQDAKVHPLFSRSAQEILGRWQQDAAMTGTNIGAFHLREHIGQGAMGSVFLAERNDGQFDQTVALKLMNPVIQDAALQLAFKEERQILAGLNHPHIARLYDGGFTEAGRPYFTMEHISGEPITTYCSHHKLNLKQRLAIFLQVCDAVSFAHRSLIIHLDLKPGNIFVNADGNAKLLDFGVARLLTEQRSADAVPSLNRFTPAYAAPEQLTGDRISTSSDVYALGTILYELLSDVHPFHHHLGDIASLREAVLSETPSALKVFPSVRFAADLDAICQKAMSKKAEARYETVHALAHDIGAWLSGHPVKVRRKKPGYVATKFISRNQKTVLVAMLAIVALTGTVVFYTGKLAHERDVAVQEATRSSEIVNLLTDVFTAADPNSGSGDTLTAVQLLDQGLIKLESNLTNQPALLASMLTQIAPIYVNLGRYEKGDSLARAALKLNEILFISPHKNLAANLVLLGLVMNTAGHLDSAEKSIAHGVAQYKQLRMTDGFEMADALIELSTVYYLKGHYVESDSVYQIAYAIHKKKLTPPHADLAYDLHMMGTTMRKLGKYEKAEEYLLASLKMKQELFKAPHLEIALTLNHLGSLKQNTGNWRGSIPYIRESFRQCTAILGRNHIETISSQCNLARAYSNLEVLDSAIALYDDALSRMRHIFPNGHYYISAALQSMGMALLRTNNWLKAEGLFREAIAMQEVLTPDDDVNRAFALMGLGKTLMRKEDHSSALKTFEAALDLRSKYLPAGHELIGVSQQAMGECLLAMKNYPTTIVLLEGAYASLQKYPGKYQQELNSILQNLADACARDTLPNKAMHYQSLLSQR